jgi:hypothetical protein
MLRQPLTDQARSDVSRARPIHGGEFQRHLGRLRWYADHRSAGVELGDTEFTLFADSNRSRRKRNRSPDGSRSGFRILKNHRTETRSEFRCLWCETPEFPRQRPGSWPPTSGNVLTSVGTRNSHGETAVAGWGARIRTAMCRISNRLSARVKPDLRGTGERGSGGARGDLPLRLRRGRIVIRSARNQQRDDPERTGISVRTER